MTTESQTKRILLVDDNPEFLSSASLLLQELSGGKWNISTFPSGGEAMASLQKSPVDVIALDVNMPVLDGVQLLGLLQRRFPQVLKVVLTGEASPEQRAACLRAGAELVLDKPVEQEGWRNIHAALDSLLTSPKEDGFHGVLRRVSLPDVIQMECLAANSSILEITGAGMRGRLFIKTGQIVHGEIGDLTGAEALNNMLCLPGGSFHLLPFVDPGRETISGQWEFLLMEAARVRDEMIEAQASSESSPRPQALPDQASIDAFSIDRVMTEPAPAVAPAAEQGPAPTPTPSEAAPAETSTGMQPVVKETLICSLAGDILYEWNCPNTLERIALLEFITKRSGTMSTCLPLGAFDRFESVDKGMRWVTKMEDGQAMFVRIQSVLSGGPDASATP
jgi:CheY-like chemotaxis protein